MAEGHSILRWARALRPLVGQQLIQVDLPRRWADRAAELPSQHLREIQTLGKHLLLHLSKGMALHCHAMMYGSWQFGKPGMKLQKPEKNVRLRLRAMNNEAVFFNGPVVELLTAEELQTHKRLASLGPDILHPDFDRDEAWERLQRAPGRPIGDALLDQTIVAGIGNIFKSEGLFLAGLDPRAAVASASRAQVERLWDLLIPVMLANAARSGPVVTLNRNLRRVGERYWAYRRTGRLCFRCNSVIEMVRQGQLRRTTYFCRRCQDHGGFLLDEPPNRQAL